MHWILIMAKSLPWPRTCIAASAEWLVNTPDSSKEPTSTSFAVYSNFGRNTGAIASSSLILYSRVKRCNLTRKLRTHVACSNAYASFLIVFLFRCAETGSRSKFSIKSKYNVLCNDLIEGNGSEINSSNRGKAELHCTVCRIRERLCRSDTCVCVCTRAYACTELTMTVTSANSDRR